MRKNNIRLPRLSVRFLRSSILITLLSLFCLPLFANAEEVSKTNSWSIQAAFLRNFAHYVTWPEDAFADESAPWHICVLGNDPFGNILENTLRGRTEKERPFSIFRTNNISELGHCQIVYVAYQISMSRRAAIAELKKLPILTVSTAPGFLDEGGIIRFDIRDNVQISINLDQARSSLLQIQTKMLEVSNEVVEKGVVHKLR